MIEKNDINANAKKKKKTFMKYFNLKISTLSTVEQLLLLEPMVDYFSLIGNNYIFLLTIFELYPH